MEKISIIVPFFNGNRHLERLKKIFDCNYESILGIASLEVIIVNDSPWIDIKDEIITSNDYSVKVIKHNKNSGIHQARVTGILHSTGDYIIMLDQDDILSKNCLKYLYQKINSTDKDCVIGNGIFQTDDGNKRILNSYGKVYASMVYKSYLILGNLLCSPGQCLIKKKAIPQFWISNIMKTNCSDDLFLWCLLMKKKNISYCNELVYLHVNTGINFSLDKKNGYISDYEVLGKLKMNGEIPLRYINIFENRYHYNIQKFNCKVENKWKYYYYEYLLKTYKLYLKLMSFIYTAIGKKVPQIDSSIFQY